MEKRTRAIAGVGTERHKQAIANIRSKSRAWPPSESRIVCAAVLFTEESIVKGTLTIEDLFRNFDQPV